MMNGVFYGTKRIFILKRVLCYEGVKVIRREQAYSRVPFSLHRKQSKSPVWTVPGILWHVRLHCRLGSVLHLCQNRYSCRRNYSDQNLFHLHVHFLSRSNSFSVKYFLTKTDFKTDKRRFRKGP